MLRGGAAGASGSVSIRSFRGVETDLDVLWVKSFRGVEVSLGGLLGSVDRAGLAFSRGLGGLVGRSGLEGVEGATEAAFLLRAMSVVRGA